ncbi:MAG: hypothetical protein PARBB_03504 [Parabacteroides distasonis]
MHRLIFVLGLLAQFCFSVRILVQWIFSEKARKVVSPSVFWLFSLIGACLMFSYGWLRDDVSILIGQLIPFYIYIENLKLKQRWLLLPNILRCFLLLFPLAAIMGLLCDGDSLNVKFFKYEDIPLKWILLGTLGQILFTCRFIIQWIYSKREGVSIIPPSFWLVSLIGAVIIIFYGLLRSDWVLILGHSFGVIFYIRNWIIGKRWSCYEADK